ncbi:MAG: aspartate carbamoyltransferase regulatory subunit [Gammaproteobacteria bacterium]|nr:aspartate carbamoyltransferase regulatory subunit [Gammaproteobacteria bacterium]MCW5582745.1 aspartate carbamoyltransferase regulatory subunit [Gammaproteobacteria bacterium]
MSKTLSVSAIQNGTAIDHIVSGQAFRIIHLLKLLDKKYQVTIGLNLPSKRLKFKDLIKIENYVLTDAQANDITVFAPEATINVIQNFEVVNKITTSLPSSISEVIVCPNPVCITRTEPVKTCFNIETQGKQINLVCRYCEKTFDRNQVLYSSL